MYHVLQTHSDWIAMFAEITYQMERARAAGDIEAEANYFGEGAELRQQFLSEGNSEELFDSVSAYADIKGRQRLYTEQAYAEDDSCFECGDKADIRLSYSLLDGARRFKCLNCGCGDRRIKGV